MWLCELWFDYEAPSTWYLSQERSLITNNPNHVTLCLNNRWKLPPARSRDCFNKWWLLSDFKITELIAKVSCSGHNENFFTPTREVFNKKLIIESWGVEKSLELDFHSISPVFIQFSGIFTEAFHWNSWPSFECISRSAYRDLKTWIKIAVHFFPQNW